MSDIRDICETYIQNMYPANLVNRNYRKNFRLLFDRVITLLHYDNYPETFSPEVFDTYRVLKGYAGIANVRGQGLLALPGSLSGIGLYDRPKNFLYSVPWLPADINSQILDIGKDCVVIFNSRIDEYYRSSTLIEIIQYFARQLSDVESSLNIALVNSRMTTVDVARTDNVRESLVAARGAIKEGRYGVITDNSILDNFSPHNVPSVNNISDLIYAERDILAQFYSCIGFASTPSKAERNITADAETAQNISSFNIEDYYNYTKRGIEKANDLFGVNMTVELCDSLKVCRTMDGKREEELLKRPEGREE